MPEGHTIHRLARDHKAWFAGVRTKVASPQGRFEAEASELNGKLLQDVTAHGKHLFYHWSGERVVHIHLGLYGKYRLHEKPFPEPRGAVRLRISGRDRALDLNGPTCCELIDEEALMAIRSRLGPDPLRSDATPKVVWDRISGSRAPIGALLLNQSVIAGIGNVYRAEILFLLGIHPDKPGNELDQAQFDDIWQLTVKLLKLGVKHNRIITVDRKQVEKPVNGMKPGKQVNVYKRDNCPNCDSKIRCWNLGNRKMYACETCQT